MKQLLLFFLLMFFVPAIDAQSERDEYVFGKTGAPKDYDAKNAIPKDYDPETNESRDYDASKDAPRDWEVTSNLPNDYNEATAKPEDFDEKTDKAQDYDLQPLYNEIWTAAYPLAVVQFSWIDFGLRHTA